jgi:hypothetical protein
MDLSKLSIEDPLLILIPLLVVLVLGGIGLAFAAWAFSLQRQVSASRRWTSTPGRIIVSEMESRLEGDSDSGDMLVYYPKVVYEYQVGGQVFHGSRILFGQYPGSTKPDAAQRKLAQYQLHSTGQVFYNPANPSEAVLEHSAPRAKTLWFIAGLLFVIIMGVMAAAAFLIALGQNRGI